MRDDYAHVAMCRGKTRPYVRLVLSVRHMLNTKNTATMVTTKSTLLMIVAIYKL